MRVRHAYHIYQHTYENVEQWRANQPRLFTRVFDQTAVLTIIESKRASILNYTQASRDQRISRTARFVTHADERNVGCVYHQRCSSIKRQTIYIGSVEVVTDPFYLEGVLYIKLTSHVFISVFPRMIFAWHWKWSGRSRPCLVYRRDGYRFAEFMTTDSG